MTTKQARYIEGVGRRKTSTARARITPATKAAFTVNGAALEERFASERQQRNAMEALELEALSQAFEVSVHVTGGGAMSQSEAVRHAIARALCKFDPTLRTELKQKGYLMRDDRMKERRKFGLRKARRAPQWSKR